MPPSVVPPSPVVSASLPLPGSMAIAATGNAKTTTKLLTKMRMVTPPSSGSALAIAKIGRSSQASRAPSRLHQAPGRGLIEQIED
jgi:hypothetical protein